MMGLLGNDTEISPLTLGLLQAGSALMSGGRQGLAQAPMAFAGGLLQGQEAQRARQAQMLREQMLRQQAEMQQREFGLKERELLAKQNERDEMQRFLATLPPEVRTAAMLDKGTAAKMLLPQKPEAPFAKIDPKDYTEDSFAAFSQSVAQGSPNYSLLRAIRKRDFVDGVAVDPYATAPGTVVNNPVRTMNELIIPGPDGQPRVNPQVMNARQQIAAAGAPRNSTTVINEGQRGFDNERALRGEFQNSATAKAFTEVQGAYDIIRNALANPSGANDLAAATKFMKLLDPGSVVRESELGMAMAATGLVDRMQNYVQMMSSGQKLTPQQRKDFDAAASTIYGAARARYAETARGIRQQASKWTLDPDAVAPPAWRIYGYKSRDAAISDARNAIMKNPQAKDEVIRRLVEEMDIVDHGIR